MTDKEKIKKVKSHIEYSDELADEICKAYACQPLGFRRLLSLKEYKKKFPSRKTIYQWRYTKEGFREKLDEAMSAKVFPMMDDTLDSMFDEYDDVSINEKGNPAANLAKINRDRNKFQFMTWYAAKWDPKRYGDTKAIELEELKKEMQEFKDFVSKKNK